MYLSWEAGKIGKQISTPQILSTYTCFKISFSYACSSFASVYPPISSGL